MASEAKQQIRNSMAITTLTVNHDITEGIALTKYKKSQWLFPFTPIGKLSMRNPECIDALDIICNFTKHELTLLLKVKQEITPHHKVIIIKNNLTSKENRQLTSAIHLWIKKGILKREKKEHCLVNPYFLVYSKTDDQLLIKQEWDNL